MTMRWLVAKEMEMETKVPTEHEKCTAAWRERGGGED